MKHFVHIEDWLAWTANPDFAIRQGYALHERSAELVLPRLLRRRLNHTGRAACDALAVLDDGSNQPLVHASRHGDACSSLQMLQGLNAGEPVSPAAFSVSVHNAVLGIYTMARGHTGPTLALGACGQEFEALINEARGYLAAGHASVIALFSEDELPTDYQPYTKSPPHPCVVVLKLSARHGPVLHATANSAQAQPTPLDIIHWLNQGGRRLVARHTWHLESA